MSGVASSFASHDGLGASDTLTSTVSTTCTEQQQTPQGTRSLMFFIASAASVAI
jgi:hypothetical protein